MTALGAGEEWTLRRQKLVTGCLFFLLGALLVGTFAAGVLAGYLWRGGLP